MASILPGYEYDIFISYRQKDNKHDGWVTEFVSALKSEIEAAFKEDVSIYFDVNPHDGLHANHEVDDSLREKLKCLILIPIISQTYCDPKAFAWEHELLAFMGLATQDKLGLKTKLTGGNVASRVLAVKIHEIATADKQLFEQATGSVMRSIDFIYKETGVNRPLRPTDDRHQNQERTDYRNQVNKVANAVKDILQSLTSRATGDAETVTVGGQAGDHSQVSGIDATIRPKIPVITFSDQLSRLVKFSRNFWRPLMLGLLIAAVGWSGYWTGSQWGASPITRPIIRYELPLKSELGRTGRHAFKLSYDGKHLVYAMDEQLMLKALDADDPAVVVPNTLGARHPFFSPDGEWIGFADHANGRIMKIRLQGSNLSKICDIDGEDHGINWYDTEVIFSSGPGIYRVPVGGGVPTLVYPQAIAEANPQIWNPQFLPGKKYVLFNESDVDGNWDIMIWKIGSKEKAVVLLEGGFDGRYLNSGHLAYTMDNRLYVSQFDISSSLTLSMPRLIETKPIYVLTGQFSRGSAQFDFSDNGLLAYYESRSTVSRHLVWIDRSGVRTQITAEAGQYSTPAISHDGRQIALGSFNATGDIDKIELVNPALGTSFEFVSPGIFPVWSPDNSTILYSVWNKVFEKPLNLSYEPRLLLELPGDEGKGGIELGNLSSDGRFLFMAYEDNIGYLDRQDTTFHTLDFINSKYESFPSISPDGKWLAYVSDFSGKSEVYVAPFPGPGQLHKISSGESYTPMWSPDMKSIYLIYQGGIEPAFMEVQVSTANGFSSGKPVLLFTGSFYNHFGFNIFGKYDIHPRGDRFLGVQNLSDTTGFKINVVVNWQQGLESK